MCLIMNDFVLVERKKQYPLFFKLQESFDLKTCLIPSLHLVTFCCMQDHVYENFDIPRGKLAILVLYSKQLQDQPLPAISGVTTPISGLIKG